MGGTVGYRETSARAVFQRLLVVAIQASDDAARRSTPLEPDAYDEVFRRTVQGTGDLRKRLLEEKKQARAQWLALEKHPQTRRLVRVRNDQRLQTEGFYHFLVDRSRLLVGHDVSAAMEAAELALAVARCLDPASHGEERVADFEAGALAALAEARRQHGDRAGAWEAFTEARERLPEGSGDPLEKAELELLRERLLRDSGRDAEADRSHERARHLFRRIGDGRLEGAAEHHPVQHRASG